MVLPEYASGFDPRGVGTEHAEPLSGPFVSGLREAARRTLWGARKVPGAAEAARITEQLESDRQLMPAANALIDRFRDVPTEVRPMADALTAWVAAEASGYTPPGAHPRADRI